MFISIRDNRTGQEYLRRLSPTEKLDIRHQVKRWAALDGWDEAGAQPSFSEPGKYIPNGCGDYQAEIRDTKAESGSCWTSEPFFMEFVEGD